MVSYALYVLLNLSGPLAQPRPDLHLVPLSNPRAHSIDLKLDINNRGTFYGQIDNLTTIKLQARFVFPVKDFGRVSITIKFPPAIDTRNFNIRL